MTAQADPESFSFQAEVVQILDLMVHSLYCNKEIFLRELISNGSDAIDRLRLELLARSESPEDEGPLQIRVSYDKDAGTITVADNGIGMSRAEVIEHIGTIAKSGTREFLHALTGDQRTDASLIGQFGVGFYSAFIVADRVVLTTRRAGLPAEEGVRWESDGRGAYTLESADSAGARHHDRAAPAGRRGRPAERLPAALDHPEVLRPHQPADRHAGRRARQPAGARRRQRAAAPRRARQPGLRAVGPVQERDQRAGLQGLLPAPDRRPRRSAGLAARQGGGHLRVHAAAVHPRHRPVRPVDPGLRARRQAARPAGVHPVRHGPADAAVPTVHPRRGRLQRPAAERVAGTAAGQPGGQPHQVRPRSSGS